ncbi:MAG: rhodanese-like domain-containing protein [Rhodoglobus sp.]
MTVIPGANEAEIDVEQAIALTAQGAYLLDVREQSEWDAGHAPGAHLLPMSVIQQRLDEVPDDRSVYVICHSGARSARVTEYLRSLDLIAINVAGGMIAWQAAGGEMAHSPAT